MSSSPPRGKHEAPAISRVANVAELTAAGERVAFIELREAIRAKQEKEGWTTPKGPWIDAHTSGFAGEFVSTRDAGFLAGAATLSRLKIGSVRRMTHFMPPEATPANGEHPVLSRLVSVPAGKLVLGKLGVHLNGFGSMPAEEAEAILSQSGHFSVTSEHISFRGTDGFLGMAPYNWSSLLALEDAGFSPSMAMVEGSLKAVPLEGSLAANELPVHLGIPRTDHITAEGVSDPHTLAFTRPHHSWPNLVNYWQLEEESAYATMALGQRLDHDLGYSALRAAHALPAMRTDQVPPRSFQ